MDYGRLDPKAIDRRTALKVLGLGVTGVAGLKTGTDTAAGVHSGDIIVTDYTALELGANTLTTTDTTKRFDTHYLNIDPQQVTYSTSTAITEKDGNLDNLLGAPGAEAVFDQVFRFDIRDQGNRQRSDAKQDSAGALEATWTGSSSLFGAALLIYNVKTSSWERIATGEEGVTLRGSVQGLGPYLDAREGYVYTMAIIQ